MVSSPAQSADSTPAMRAAPNTTNANSPPCASSVANSQRCRDVTPIARATTHSVTSFSTSSPASSAAIVPGRASQQAEVDRHADGDEEEAEQQALERLDVGLERVAVLGAREQHAGEERAERHRDAGQRHQLRDADDEQQRERGEHLADVGGGDDAQDRAASGSGR